MAAHSISLEQFCVKSALKNNDAMDEMAEFHFCLSAE